MTCRLAPFLLAIAALVITGCGDLTEPAPPTLPATTQAPNIPQRDPNQYGGVTNVVPNASFESGIPPWTALGTTSALQLTNALYRHGRTALRSVAVQAAPYGAAYIAAVANPAKGDRYTFSVWVRTADRPKRIAAVIQARGTGTDARSQIVAIVRKVVRDRWVQFVAEGTVRLDDMVALDVAVSVETSIAIGDAFFIDGVILTSH